MKEKLWNLVKLAWRNLRNAVLCEVCGDEGLRLDWGGILHVKRNGTQYVHPIHYIKNLPKKKDSQLENLSKLNTDWFSPNDIAKLLNVSFNHALEVCKVGEARGLWKRRTSHGYFYQMTRAEVSPDMPITPTNDNQS